MGFSRQEYWSGLPFPSPGDLDPGIEPGSPALWADALPSEPPGKSMLLLLLLLLSHFSRVRLCATPETAAHQVPPIPGILHARTLEWVAISFPTGSSRPRDRTQVSCIVGRCFTL